MVPGSRLEAESYRHDADLLSDLRRTLRGQATSMKKQTANTNCTCTEAVPTVAGSHMSMFRPMPRLPRDEASVSLSGEVSSSESSTLGILNNELSTEVHTLWQG